MSLKKTTPKTLARAKKSADAAKAAEKLSRSVSRSKTIRDLLAYRLHVVANTISRSAAARYRREFDVTLGEWRSIALLARYGPLGLNHLARQGGVDRGQISRIVAGLTSRGLVSRTHQVKGKPVSLVLTAKGEKVYGGLFKAAVDRDEVFLGALTAAEQTNFDRMLNKILTVARQVEHDEKSATVTGLKDGARET